MNNNKQSILIVDDKRANLISLSSILEELDVEIITAISGKEALIHLLEKNFALVILDVVMPEMDGFETAGFMRGNSRTRDIPIIFLSALSKEKHFIFRGYEAGGVDYLTKPVDDIILLSKVKVFLDLHKQNVTLKEMSDTLKQRVRELDEKSAQLE